jgi:hypothetical protein
MMHEMNYINVKIEAIYKLHVDVLEDCTFLFNI